MFPFMNDCVAKTFLYSFAKTHPYQIQVVNFKDDVQRSVVLIKHYSLKKRMELDTAIKKKNHLNA